MSNFKNKPELWLLVLIVGLPQLSETVYTPALPDIARSLLTSHSMIEYTLTIYLFGFALGTLLWGKLSDNWGRKPALLAGLIIYILGCIGCFYSGTISMLMLSRLVQAFGGSTGSVLGQAICRDSFHGAERGKVFSIISSALAFSPAFGPIIGGSIDQIFGWPFIFLFLIMAGVTTLIATIIRLPETHIAQKTKTPITTVLGKMVLDKQVIAYGFIVAACNGITFSYFAEGSFYLIDGLGLTPANYGFSFIFLALAGLVGSYTSKKMYDLKFSAFNIMTTGSFIISAGTTIFLIGTLTFNAILITLTYSIALTISCMAIIMTGIGVMIPSVLSRALENYSSTIGTASSLFGFYYYTLISFFTLIMGAIHNSTLLPMPIYFFIISTSILIISKQITRQAY